MILKGAGLGVLPGRTWLFLVLYALVVLGIAYARLARREV